MTKGGLGIARPPGIEVPPHRVIVCGPIRRATISYACMHVCIRTDHTQRGFVIRIHTCTYILCRHPGALAMTGS